MRHQLMGNNRIPISIFLSTNIAKRRGVKILDVSVKRLLTVSHPFAFLFRAFEMDFTMKSLVILLGVEGWKVFATNVARGIVSGNVMLKERDYE